MSAQAIGVGRVIGGTTRVAAVIGWPVAHSKSPAIHNAGFAAAGIDAVYVALAIAPENLAAAVRGMAAQGMLGASVTVPHKEAVIGSCDRLDASAEGAGAVNCLVFEDGAIVGHNTDAGGFVDAVEEGLAVQPAGLRVVLLGAGGAARAVAAGLGAAGCQSLQVVARKPVRVTWCQARPWNDVELASLLKVCDLLVDCTPVDLGKGAYPSMPDLDRMAPGSKVVSLVYGQPSGQPSALLAAAAAAGLGHQDGTTMLLHQGARAFTLWTGVDAPLDAMRAALGA